MTFFFFLKHNNAETSPRWKHGGNNRKGFDALADDRGVWVAIGRHGQQKWAEARNLTLMALEMRPAPLAWIYRLENVTRPTVRIAWNGAHHAVECGRIHRAIPLVHNDRPHEGLAIGRLLANSVDEHDSADALDSRSRGAVQLHEAHGLEEIRVQVG